MNVPAARTLRPDGSSLARRTLGPHAPDSGGDSMDLESMLHRRRKSALRSLSFELEREIEPYVRPGNQQAVTEFKRHMRKAINSIVFEAIELMRDSRAEVNEHAVDLAGDLAFDDNDGGLTQT